LRPVAHCQVSVAPNVEA